MGAYTDEQTDRANGWKPGTAKRVRVLAIGISFMLVPVVIFVLLFAGIK